MVILFTSVAGLMMWIIMWALGIKGVVGFAAGLFFVGIAVGIQRIVNSLPSRSE
jgi:hypothetical protein